MDNYSIVVDESGSASNVINLSDGDITISGAGVSILSQGLLQKLASDMKIPDLGTLLEALEIPNQLPESAADLIPEFTPEAK